MKISGFQKFSLIDYPKKISAIIFTQGCNFRCPWCHNPELVIPEQYECLIDPEEILNFLNKRKGKLDAVCITGGEACLHEDLPDFIKLIKDMGYFIKLDTNGSQPEMLKKLLDLNLIDYLAMDIKASYHNYPLLTGSDVDIEKIKASISLIKNANIDYEFRTTYIPDLMNEDELYFIQKELGPVKNHYIQHFEPNKTIDFIYASKPKISEDTWDKLKKTAFDKKYIHFR